MQCLPHERGFPGSTNGKENACQCRRQDIKDEVQYLCQEDPLKEGMAQGPGYNSWLGNRFRKPLEWQEEKKAHYVKHRGYYDLDSHSYLEAYSTERQNNGSTLRKYLLHIFILWQKAVQGGEKWS